MPVAVVTGASRGLGLALTTELFRQGWDLVVDARNEQALRAATRDLAGEGDLVVVPGDVTNPGHVAELASAAAGLGDAHLLVNNASTLGASPLPAIAALDPGVLAGIFATNVFAPVALIQALLPQLSGAEGRIVNITSDAAVEAYENWGGYGSSKAALEQATAVLAAEHPALRVYAFDPGDMRTQMHQDAFPGEDISDRPGPATVVPALLRLVHEQLSSGRYRATDLLTSVSERTSA